MKIKSLQLKNFKRFTDLSLQGIPEQAKLVLLIGSNGSGKSCVFDAFSILAGYSGFRTDSESVPFGYYAKNKRKGYEIAFKTELDNEFQTVTSGDSKISLGNNNFYGRTSLRQVPRLSRKQLGSIFDISTDKDRPIIFIDRDERFENDLEHIFGQLLKEFFAKDDEKSEIKQKVIFPINEALSRIFLKDNGTKLELTELIPPLDGRVAQVTFRKGNSLFHYNLLSAGEKEIFNILINLVARRAYFNDTIFFFDEIDLHLNTRLQYNLIKEITENWIPENCQFWTASHSLGFIQYAKESEQAVIFDFDDFDFDEPKILVPESKDNADIYEIAVSAELLAELFKDRKIVFIENEDKDYYAAVNSKDYIFVKSKNRDSVFYKAKDGKFWGIVDRDFLTDTDIEVIENQYKTLKVLKMYCIENYLFHPDNLEEYFNNHNKTFDKTGYVDFLVKEKNKVTDHLSVKIASIRQGYPYFKQPENEKSAHRKRFTPDEANFIESQVVIANLKSNDVNEFLKSLSLKDYGKSAPQRANITPSDLAKTNWFKQQIESIIK